MFLNKLVNIARQPRSIQQLTSELKLLKKTQNPKICMKDFFQKSAISTTPAICSKLEIQKPQNLWSTSKDLNPADRINEQLKSNEIGRLFAVVHLCGKQFKVTAGDVILVEGYWQPRNGDQLRLDKVTLPDILLSSI